MSKAPRNPEPQPMVAWLAPSILLKSGLEVALSGLFANFADKRELMGGLDASLFTVGDDADPEFWFDFISDTGDGFDPSPGATARP